MSVIKTMLKNPHWVSSKYTAFWNFLLQSYEGGLDYSNSTVVNGTANGTNGLIDTFHYYVNGELQQNKTVYGNLFMHPKERVEDYNRRVFMSYYYNFCAPIIDIYSDHLFKQDVNEDFGSIESTVNEVRDDIDMQGSNIDEFRRAMGDMAQLYGHCFVVVDSPNNMQDDSVVTRQDQINKRAFPYLTLIPPQSVINWSLDRFGSPYWVLIKEAHDGNENADEFDPKECKEIYYRLWTRDEWRLYDEDYELIGQGTHDLKEVPIVCVFSKRSKKVRNFLGISEIADISFIARDIYNASSELRQILRDQTFAFLAIQGNSDEYSALDLGTAKGLLYPEGRNVPQYVSPQSDNALTYFQHIDRQISKIYQIAKLEGGGVQGQAKAQPSSTVDNQSGASKAWDFNQTNSSLSSKSSNLEDAEMKIWSLFAKWEGKEFDGSIQYPNEFSVTSLQEDLDEAEKEARLDLGKTFNTEVRKAIVRKKFPRKTEEELAVMDKEIGVIAAKATTGSAMAERVGALLNKNNTTTGGLKQGVNNGR